MSDSIVNKFADRIVTAGSSVIGKIAEDRVRENVDAYRPQNSGQNSGSGSFQVWDIAANTISIIAFFIGLFGLITSPSLLPKSLIMLPILLIIFIFDLPSLMKLASQKAGFESSMLDTVVEKMAVLNQQTKGLIYIVSGIVVWALFQLSFVMTGLMIVSAGGLHVYIHRFLKNGGTAPENDAENQF